MATKDITDRQVVKAFAKVAESREKGPLLFADDLLVAETNQPRKVVLCAMERACERGLIDYGGNIIGAWPTEKGRELLGARVTTA